MIRRRDKKRTADIDPDQIFLDSSNLPDFDVDQFEGRIEKPILKSSIVLIGVFFFSVGALFAGRAVFLQVASGQYFAERSQSNNLKKVPVSIPRGTIYDRNGIPLSWNENLERLYIGKGGLAHLVGYIGYLTKEEARASPTTTVSDLVGKIGIEKKYDDILRGIDGSKTVEVNAKGETQSEYLYEPGQPGKDVVLSVDSRVSKKLYQSIENLATEYKFKAGAAVIMDVKTGELLAMTSYPEYDPGILSSGSDAKTIVSYFRDDRTPFLNRVISGLYVPGSVVKPIFALAALNESIITPEKQILSKGHISIPNPFFPGKLSVFRDWRVHGYVDMKRALAVSSDVYFYTIGGGYEDQNGLGIYKLGEYARMFGLGSTTELNLDNEGIGNIPTPEWKAENFDGDKWRIGDTYISSIGQYGFLVTPIQMVRVAAALATDGKIIKPSALLKTLPEGSDNLNQASYTGEFKTIDISNEMFEVVKSGMRRGVTDSDGTARALNIPEVTVAAKTGTAELGVSKKLVNSWSIGFFPYENPRFAFAIVMEKGSRENTVGANLVMRNLLIWMAGNTPEYIR